MEEYLREQIHSNIIDMLVKKIGDIKSHMKEINVSDACQVPGQAHAVEFIQIISAVLALDQNVQQDILVMRKNLLKYIKVKECGVEAGFIDPGPSFILPKVACSNCDAYRDLDLCRDPSLLTEREWSCPDPQCGKKYDREQMENRLLQMMRHRENVPNAGSSVH